MSGGWEPGPSARGREEVWGHALKAGWGSCLHPPSRCSAAGCSSGLFPSTGVSQGPFPDACHSSGRNECHFSARLPGDTASHCCRHVPFPASQAGDITRNRPQSVLGVGFRGARRSRVSAREPLRWRQAHPPETIGPGCGLVPISTVVLPVTFLPQPVCSLSSAPQTDRVSRKTVRSPLPSFLPEGGVLLPGLPWSGAGAPHSQFPKWPRTSYPEPIPYTLRGMSRRRTNPNRPKSHWTGLRASVSLL